MQYTIKTTLHAHEVTNGKDITKEEQAKLVQGRRFYMPVEISWQYEINNKSFFEMYHFSIGEPYLQHSNMDMDTGILYTYQLKSSTGKTTNLLLSAQKLDGSYYKKYNDPT